MLHCDSAAMKYAPLGKTVNLYDFHSLIRTMKLISASIWRPQKRLPVSLVNYTHTNKFKMMTYVMINVNKSIS